MIQNMNIALLTKEFEKKISSKHLEIHATRINAYRSAYSNMLKYESLDKKQRVVFLNQISALDFNLDKNYYTYNIKEIFDHKKRRHLVIFLPDRKNKYTLKDNYDINQLLRFQQIETAVLSLSMIFFGPERKVEKFSRKENKILEFNKPLDFGGIELNNNKNQRYIAIIQKHLDNKFHIVGCCQLTDHGKKDNIDYGMQLSRVVSIKTRQGVASALQIASLLTYQDRIIFLHSRFARSNQIYAPMDRRHVYNTFFQELGAPFLYGGMKNIRMESTPLDKTRKKILKMNSHLNQEEGSW